jgi:uncharacterized phage protein (TIGR01671 family)
MKKIKFRAWFIDKKFKVLEEQKCSMQEERTLLEFLQDVKDCADENGYDFILTQFTGLLDKNKREVYEGDIIKVLEHYEGDYFIETYLGEVVFEEGQFFIKGKGFLKEYCSIFDAVNNYNGEIVGNIYENPGFENKENYVL